LSGTNAVPGLSIGPVFVKAIAAIVIPLVPKFLAKRLAHRFDWQ
jgi:hypothetical protein